MRRILFCFVAAIAASLLWALILSSTAFAADASWVDSNTISYQGDEYAGPTQPEIVKNIGLPEGTQVYSFLDESPAASVSPSNSPATTVAPAKQTLYVIFFAKGVDVSSATIGKYETLDYLGPNNYKNPSQAVNITIDHTKTIQKSGTSCSVSGGMGWMICPMANFFAGALDKVYDVLSEFLNVKPVSMDTDSTLYRAWSYMRSFANIAFVIAFLIIIYSQLTSVGISNYGIKKLLPRLIIAALLVNLSYYICAIGIDLSNILGNSIQDVFMNIRNNLVIQTTNTNDFVNTTGVILSGGTALAAGGTVLVLYGVTGTIYLLLPVLISGFFSVLVALLVIAGRQAIITVLLIMSPLAFVAYLLPNTEKWFEKWQSTFMTMLILFPAFSVVYGGSQLAAAAILQNADTWNVAILSMFVQLAPLMITPLLIKLSGSTLGKLAQMASAPGNRLSGMASKYFREDRAATARSGRLARENVGRLNPLRAAQRFDRNKRDRKFTRDTNEGVSDALWKERSTRYQRTDFRARQYSDRKSIAEGRSELAYNLEKNNPGRIQTIDTELRSVNDMNTHQKAITDSNYDVWQTSEFQRNGNPEWTRQSANMQQHLDDARITAEGISIQAMRKQSAANAKQKEFASALEGSLNLRQLAGASVIDPLGDQRALAAAINVTRKAHADTIANASSIIERGNLTDDATVQLALGNGQIGSNGQPIDATEDMIEAAIARIAGGGNVKAILQLMDNVDLTPAANEHYRTAFTTALGGNSNRPKFAGFGWLGAVNQGIPGGVGPSGIDSLIVSTINSKKFSAAALTSQDQDVLQRTFEVMDEIINGPNVNGHVLNANSLQYLKDQIAIAYEPEYEGQIGERDDQLHSIDNLIP